MTYLQSAKWGNSLAVRIPMDYVRQMGLKQGDGLQVPPGADGGWNLRPPATGSRQAFVQELPRDNAALPIGGSVVEQRRRQARY